MNKIYTYTELKQLKEAGKKLDWKTISKEQLYQLAMVEELIDSQIEDLYDVTNSQVINYKQMLTYFKPSFMSLPNTLSCVL